MFTGIVEEKGTVKSISRGQHSAVITVSAKKVLQGTVPGDSIAVNGICLTVTSLGPGWFTADVMHETLNRSSLSDAAAETFVNLERAMAAGGRFGGHIVSGHVDGTGVIREIRRDDNAVWFTVSAPGNIMKYIVEKGSVAIDGISLTVASVRDDFFDVSVIPHTLGFTVLGDRCRGDVVNIENDIIGKYVEKLMNYSPDSPEDNKGGITEEMLIKYGF
ncbi:MAG TPA: riboflavin synthase [Candidatus Avanaerovorax faecigallinarum]|nr:riboflavin synthase [Candidatus Avanaerovorax faecigallinarum]